MRLRKMRWRMSREMASIYEEDGKYRYDDKCLDFVFLSAGASYHIVFSVLISYTSVFVLHSPYVRFA
jgi:hypothetical protein